MRSYKEKIKEQLSISDDIRAIRVIDKIFNFAIGCEAEEIYFEPRDKNLAVNFLVQGELKNTLLLPKKAEPAVIAAIKEMAGINYPADNSPRGGNFKKDHLGCKIIFSLNIHPTEEGEKIIVNLKKEKLELLGLGRLGFSGKILAQVKRKLSARKGLIAVVGDQNSGCTATLYNFINFLNCPELNIATVEKNVACDLPEINQSRLDPRVGFNSGTAVNALRRQDADVVMIEEIDDRETAEAAFHLASAGHFVIAGINGADLATTLDFLQELGISLSLFSANVKMLITQRLVDKNCPHCLKRQKIGRENLLRLEKKLSLKKLLFRLKRDKIISEKITRPEDLVFYRSRGCSRCQERGSSGRIGIFEVLEITPEVKNLIKTGHFSAIRNEVKKQGSYSLAEDALIKALNGLVSFETFFRVID
jgi:type II secretory ATPase GspE/PulE/Tfp pilus assembly ATPase PilB-like protein